MDLDFSPRQEASCTLVNTAGKTFPVRLIAVSGSQLTIDADVELSPGVPVEITWTTHIVLAEVTARNSQGFTVLTIRHAMLQDDIETFRRKWS